MTTDLDARATLARRFDGRLRGLVSRHPVATTVVSTALAAGVVAGWPAAVGVLLLGLLLSTPVEESPVKRAAPPSGN